MMEIKYPYYYVEYMPENKIKTGHLQSIGSLARITSYVSACSRVKLMQSFDGLNVDSDIVYLDKKTLIIKDNKIKFNWTTGKSDQTLASGSGPHQYLHQSSQNSYQGNDIGKWLLEYETAMIDSNEQPAEDKTVENANHLFQNHLNMLI